MASPHGLRPVLAAPPFLCQHSDDLLEYVDRLLFSFVLCSLLELTFICCVQCAICTTSQSVFRVLRPSIADIRASLSQWGTKGSTTVSDLGAAKLTKKDGKDVLEYVD